MKSQSSLQELRINTKPIKLAASVLRALNHNLRQQILVLIDKNSSITVNEIRFKLKLEQSVTSQHLAILRHAGFVLTEREGKYIYYYVNYDKIKQVEELCKDISDSKMI